jgi:sugar phosphate isomerase/epimerase
MRAAAAVSGPSGLEPAAEAGFAAVELPAPPDARAVERLGAASLALAAVVLPILPRSSRLAQERAIEEALDLVSAVGDLERTVALLLDATDDPERAAAAGRVEEHRFLWTRGSRLGQVADAAHRAADHARERGLHVAFLPRPGTPIETPREVDALAYALDPDLLGLAFDVAGWQGEPLAYVAEFGELTRYVRVGDGGDADLLDRLRVVGYDGWIVAAVGDETAALAAARERLADAGVG